MNTYVPSLDYICTVHSVLNLTKFIIFLPRSLVLSLKFLQIWSLFSSQISFQISPIIFSFLHNLKINFLTRSYITSEINSMFWFHLSILQLLCPIIKRAHHSAFDKFLNCRSNIIVYFFNILSFYKYLQSQSHFQ